jgi:type IV pilus assembly protein PilW
VELLVALTLGAFITVGIVQMFTANRETYQMSVGQARLQENARFAMRFIERPLRMAGFTGCFSDNQSVRNVLNPDPGTGLVPYEFDFAQPIEGFEGTGTQTWSPNPSRLPSDVDLTLVESGTDILVVRLAESEGLRVVGGMPSNQSPVQASAGDPSRYGAGTVLLISDCEKATVFQSTAAAGTGPIQIDHAAGSAGVTPGNQFLELTDDAGLTFGAESTVHRIETQIFFIAPGAGTNNAGNAPLSLWRKEADQAPVELVEGISDLQVTFGVDADGDRVPDQYRTIQNVNLLPPANDRIVTVRVSLTVNSVDVVTEDAAATPGGLLERQFTKTFLLRNRV